MNATGLPSNDLTPGLDTEREVSARAHNVELLLLSIVSLLATMATISVFGTHVNTWLGAISVAVASR